MDDTCLFLFCDFAVSSCFGSVIMLSLACTRLLSLFYIEQSHYITYSWTYLGFCLHNQSTSKLCLPRTWGILDWTGQYCSIKARSSSSASLTFSLFSLVTQSTARTALELFFHTRSCLWQLPHEFGHFSSNWDSLTILRLRQATKQDYSGTTLVTVQFRFESSIIAQWDATASIALKPLFLDDDHSPRFMNLLCRHFPWASGILTSAETLSS